MPCTICVWHVPKPNPQNSELEIAVSCRNLQIHGCELFQKLVKGFLGQSSRSKKLSYNARARAHLSVAPPFSELYLSNTHRFENSMLQNPQLNSSHAQIGSKELQEMVSESVTLTAGSAGAHPAASRVAD
jgi:hypothetical protein